MYMCLITANLLKKVQLNLSAFEDDLSDLIIYVPNDSGLQLIETAREVLEYVGEEGFRSDY